MDLTREHMRTLIERYFAGCNEADTAAMTACFVPNAVHYFPAGSPVFAPGPFVGAEVIAQRWADTVREAGSSWTVDNFVGDESTGVAVIEWTHFRAGTGVMLRGDEWYRFDPATGLIAEIRAYYAAPQPTGVATVELGGFDYAGRGYPLTSPVQRPDRPSR
ncbi:nuclear transport factor 2 family protein [Streptomyces longwoodensis]|uniref:nuclear transport factor 2 family protein n=1 Tax=Streptomyces longwoodensis TaxID=68231 RepID=UPI0033C22BC1